MMEAARAFAAGSTAPVEALAPAEGNGPVAGLGRKTAETLFSELASPEVAEVVAGLARHGVLLGSTAAPIQKVAGIAALLKSHVDPVPGEENTGNNSYEYPVIFTL